MPPKVVTVTCTVPEPDGGVAEMLVAEFTLMSVASAVPNLTAVVPVKLVPIIVTLVPPAVGPLGGEIDVTVGAGASDDKIVPLAPTAT